MQNNSTSSSTTDSMDNVYNIDNTLMNDQQQQQPDSCFAAIPSLAKNLLQSSVWNDTTFGIVTDGYSFGSSILPTNPHMAINAFASLTVPLSPAHIPPSSPIARKVPELLPKGKLSINTTAIRRSATSPMLLQTPHTALSGYSNAGGQIVATPITPLRRRTNYTTNDMGPIFAPTKQLVEAMSMDRSKAIRFLLMGRIDKGFFMANDEWACYRRNYFQVSGSFGLSYSAKMPASGNPNVPLNVNQNLGGEDCLIEWEGRQRPILRYKLGVLARVSASEKEIILVQHTTKRDKGPQESPAPKPIAVSRRNSDMTSMGADFFSNEVVTYERLQFKAATANNGKRRAAQQYFVVDLVLYGEVQRDDGTVVMVKLATSSSCSLVVRGRSPGHYLDGSAPMSAITMASYPALSPGAAFSAITDGSSNYSLSANAFGASPEQLSNCSLYGPASNTFSSVSYDQLSLAPSSAYGAVGNLSNLSLNSPFGDAANLNNLLSAQDPSFQNFPYGGCVSHSQDQQQQQQHFDSNTTKMLAMLDMGNVQHTAATLMNFPSPMIAPNSIEQGGSLLSDESLESALRLS